MESARVVLWGGGESFSDHRHHRDLQHQPQHPERPRWSLPEDDDEDCLSSFAQEEDHRQQWGTAPYHKRPRHRAGWVHDDDGDDADDDEDDRTIDDDDEGAALPEDYPYGWTPGDAPPAAVKEKRRRPGSDAADLDSIPQTSSSSGAPDSPSLTSRGRGSSGTGSLFFKTKLCIKFRAGTCPYNSNCNFAHGMEELRNPPPGWEEIVAVQDAERGPRSNNSSKDLSSQYILSSSGPGNMPDSQRFRRTRRCKKYYSDEGCPYGDRCNFLHDDQARARESNAISLGPTSGPVNGGGGNSGNGGERPSNWKTRMCNKWEMTGHCPFGQKCNFAHGFTELQMYGGAHGEAETGAPAGTSATTDTKTARVSSKSFSEVGSLYAPSVYATDGHNVTSVKYRAGFLLSVKSQKQASRPLSNWKGPVDEVSTIYGDWIEEDE